MSITIVVILMRCGWGSRATVRMPPSRLELADVEMDAIFNIANENYIEPSPNVDHVYDIPQR